MTGELDVVWMMCECYVWPIQRTARWWPAGSCGRCRSGPTDDTFEDRASAVKKFREIHGHNPVPIRRP